MKKLKWLLLTIGILALLFVFVGLPMLKEQTKKHSPQKTTTFKFQETEVTVNYSSPSKKGRTIFGELVPYGNVWRTGANEPTTFTTSDAIKIIDKSLPAGTYSLWTIPNKDSWKIIFNTEIPDWGVTLLSGGKETTRNPDADIITVEVPAYEVNKPIENLVINFSTNLPPYLIISWDETTVKVPLNK